MMNRPRKKKQESIFLLLDSTWCRTVACLTQTELYRFNHVIDQYGKQIESPARKNFGIYRKNLKFVEQVEMTSIGTMIIA